MGLTRRSPLFVPEMLQQYHMIDHGQVLINFFARHLSLQRLLLRDSSFLDDAFLTNAWKVLPNVQLLSISDCPDFEGDGLYAYPGAGWTKLGYLRLLGSQKLRSNCIKTIAATTTSRNVRLEFTLSNITQSPELHNDMKALGYDIEYNIESRSTIIFCRYCLRSRHDDCGWSYCDSGSGPTDL